MVIGAEERVCSPTREEMELARALHAKERELDPGLDEWSLLSGLSQGIYEQMAGAALAWMRSRSPE